MSRHRAKHRQFGMTAESEFPIESTTKSPEMIASHRNPTEIKPPSCSTVSVASYD